MKYIKIFENFSVATEEEVYQRLIKGASKQPENHQNNRYYSYGGAVVASSKEYPNSVYVLNDINNNESIDGGGKKFKNAAEAETFIDKSRNASESFVNEDEDKFTKLIANLTKAKVQCRVKLMAGDKVVIECGWNYPDRIGDKAHDAAVNAGFSPRDIDVNAESDGGTVVKSARVNGGPKRY